ncbi:uncharacterized protein LOC120005598 isoform X3 [Tripterygium wilfordii]|uniref:uncharacterized protein LOC120005598 isoform X3 n=2 Tax=Tripterygium wilfordii TaxID=458696 RepID=UPI0018F8324E|nr:uncharacterized protein LOC120005598 isoform X3 [Tripterygium wilfordii]
MDDGYTMWKSIRITFISWITFQPFFSDMSKNIDESCSVEDLIIPRNDFVQHYRPRAMVLADRSKKEVPAIGLSLAAVESLSMPLVQEVVLSADIRCARCQSRVAEIMSRMKEMDSVSVNVLEKKVTVTSRYPVVKAPPKLVAALYKKPLGKAAIIKHIFRSSLR